MRALLLPAGADVYAVDLALVREVIRLPRVTRLPAAPAVVVGLFNLRGEVVALLDTAALLGLGRLAEPAFTVVVETARGAAGLTATGEPTVLDLPDEALASELPGTESSRDLGDRVVTVLDVTALIGPLAAESTLVEPAA